MTGCTTHQPPVPKRDVERSRPADDPMVRVKYRKCGAPFLVVTDKPSKARSE